MAKRTSLDGADCGSGDQEWMMMYSVMVKNEVNQISKCVCNSLV